MKGTKDLAAEMALHPRTVKRWWKKLGVPPTVAAHGCHRWSEAAAALLVQRWADYWAVRGHSAAAMGEKYAGTLSDKKQLTLPFPAVKPGKKFPSSKK